MKNLRILFALLSMVVMQSCFQAKPGTIEVISPEEAEQIIDSKEAVIVDVRTKEAFLKGHLKDAIHISLNDENFSELIAQLDVKKPVMVYCGLGKGSARCAKILINEGFQKVYDLDGGLSKWESSGRKIVLKATE